MGVSTGSAWEACLRASDARGVEDVQLRIAFCGMMVLGTGRGGGYKGQWIGMRSGARQGLKFLGHIQHDIERRTIYGRHWLSQTWRGPANELASLLTKFPYPISPTTSPSRNTTLPLTTV